MARPTDTSAKLASHSALFDQSSVPHLPGTGSSRATRLVELYARLVHPPLTVLIVDSLTRIFRSRGATEDEFSHYLGLPNHTIQSGVDRLPAAVLAHVAVEDSDVGDSVGDGVGDRNGMQRRYFINYRSALPFIVAHFRAFMIPLCHVSPLPFSLTPSGGGAAGGALAAGYSVSPKLLQGNDDKGLFCAGCSTWQSLTDLRPHSTRCCVCNADILVGALRTAQAAWTATLANAESGIRAPAASGGLLTADGSCAAVAPDGTPVAKVLREDPYVLQQALVMHFLSSNRFCFVDKDIVASDPDGVMTVEEFTARAAHRSSLAERFRARHRNGAHLRVKLTAQLDAEREQLHRNRVRLRRRGHLPPWLLSSAAITGPQAESQHHRPPVVGTSVAKRRRIEDPSRDPAAEALRDVRALADMVCRRTVSETVGVDDGEEAFVTVIDRSAH